MHDNSDEDSGVVNVLHSSYPEGEDAHSNSTNSYVPNGNDAASSAFLRDGETVVTEQTTTRPSSAVLKPLPSYDNQVYDAGSGNFTSAQGFWVHMERIFEVEKRGTTWRAEAVLGVVQFISCLYVLPVVPEQMAQAGYNTTGSIVATAATCCIGCIFGAFVTNTPFIIAPPTSVSIFLAVFLKQQGLSRHDGNEATMISGFLLIAVGLIRPLSAFISRLIPDCIQASTAVGIGLITALAGATEVHLVVRGEHTILDMGPFTTEIAVCILSVVVIAIFLYYHIKGAFCAGLIFGSLSYWILEGGWPESLMFLPEADYDYLNGMRRPADVLLLFDLLFLYILVLNGLARSLSDLSKLTLPDGSIPRGRWLFVVCGITTVISGHMSGPPILISPESAAGVKAGAKTGFSTLICGALFGVSAFFAPFFADIPAAGTAPLLIMVGVLLFQNAKRIDWYQPNYAVPAFCCLFFIPFTYSILRGVAFGYATYILIGIFTGDFWLNSVMFFKEYLGLIKTESSAVEGRARAMSLQEAMANPTAFLSTIINSDFMNSGNNNINGIHLNKAETYDPSKVLETKAETYEKLATANEVFAELTNINIARDILHAPDRPRRGTLVPDDEDTANLPTAGSRGGLSNVNGSPNSSDSQQIFSVA